MTLEEITQYLDEQSVRGDLAREFTSIINDYQAGNISAEDKEQLVSEVIDAYKARGLAVDEQIMRWVIVVASIAAKAI